MATDDEQRGRGDLATAVDQAAALLATQPLEAELMARALLRQAPGDPRILLILGSARRRLGDGAGARSILEPLVRRYTRAANTHYEFGAALALLGERVSAITILRRAVMLSHDQVEAWRALGDQLFLHGDPEGAEAAYAEHARASVRDPRLKPAARALFDGDLVTAEWGLRSHLTLFPDDLVAMNMLAEVFARKGRHGDAEALLARCLDLDCDFHGARFSYANALFQQQRAPEAIPHVERLLAKEPTNPAYRNLLAGCLGLIGDHDAVNALYEGLLQEYPTQPKIWLNYGHALRTVGRHDDALAAYNRCIGLAPALGDAYWSLANLKVSSFTAPVEAAMRLQVARPGALVEDRLHLHYALGKAREDAGDFARSFEHYAQGAALRRATTPYDANELSSYVARAKALFTRAFFAHRAGGSSAADPIFIVGLPRSGSTLIEQILASHATVEGTMELPDIGLIARRLGSTEPDVQPPRYPEVLATTDPALLCALGDRYVADTRVHRRSEKSFFIDKMPNNFLHLGLIQLILPKAKIIDVRRHPMGACFSAFKQHFAQGQNFSYDLIDLGKYYCDYLAMMHHFDAVLPGRIYRVIYEDVIEDTEGEVRRLLNHCGLPFEASCLAFYENKRAVRTVSSEQVRRPIFRDGLEHWRRFAPWLRPLETALGPALETWREL